MSLRSRLILSRTLVIVAVAAAVAFAALARPSRPWSTASDEALAQYDRGMENLLQVHNERAKKCFEQALEADPDFAMAMVRLAQLDLDTGRIESALGWTDRAEQLTPRLSEEERWRVALVRARLRSDLPASRRICEQAIADDPSDPEAYDWLARTCLEEGRIEEACGLLLRVIEIDPTRTDAYNSLGYFLADLGRWDESMEALSKYAFICADHPNPQDSLGELCERTGRFDDALTYYARAIEIDSTFAHAYLARARALAKLGRFAEAEQTLADCNRAAPPATDDVMRELAFVYLEIERDGLADAVARIEAWLARDTRSTAMVFALAQANSAAGDPAATARAAEWRRSLWMDRHPGASPDTASMPTIRALDALLPAANGDHRAAAAAYETLLTDPAISWDWREELEIDCVRSWILAGEPARALALIHTSAERAPWLGEMQYWRARALESSGQLDAAVVAYAETLEFFSSADPEHTLREDARERRERLLRRA